MLRKSMLVSIMLTLNVVFCMEAPQEEQVELKTQDGGIFKVNKSSVLQFQTIKSVIEESGTDAPIPLPAIRSNVWRNITSLLPLSLKKDNRTLITMLEKMKAEDVIDIVAAANYLENPFLLEIALKALSKNDLKKELVQPFARLPQELRSSYVAEKLNSKKNDPIEIEGFTIKAHKDGVNSLCVTNDGTKVFSGSRDKTIVVSDLVSGKQIANLGKQEDEVIFVGLNKSNTHMFSCTSNGVVRIWDAHTYVSLGLYKVLEEVTSCCLSADGTKILIGTNTVNDMGYVHVLDSSNGKKIGEFKTKGAVVAIAVSPDNTLIATSSTNEDIVIWNTQTFQPIKKIDPGYMNVFQKLCITPSNQIVTYLVERILAYDFTTGQQIMPFSGLTKSEIDAITLIRDGSKVIAGDDDGIIGVTEISKDPSKYTFKSVGKKQEHMIRSIALSGQDEKLVAGYRDGVIRVWDFKSLESIGKSIQTINIQKSKSVKPMDLSD